MTPTPTISPAQYSVSDPIHIVSLGAGVQSSTMALMAAKGEITPMPKCAIFADTQAEPQSVYKWLDWLEKRLPFPVVRVTAGKLETAALRIRKSAKGKLYNDVKIPAFTLSPNGDRGMVSQRNCTEDFKIIPIRKAARIAGNVKRGTKTHAMTQWIGISLDEVSRMKESRDAWIVNRWPLVDLRMRRADCLAWMQKQGYPTPPRSACVFCPFHDNAEWRRLKREEPSEFSRAVAFEEKLRRCRDNPGASMFSEMFLHASRKPLNEVDFSTEEEQGQLNMFNNECSGLCGV